MRRAHNLGLRYFDTAPLYGYGSAERRVGCALVGLSRSTFVVSTKVGRLLRDTTNSESSYDIDSTQSFNGEPFCKGTGSDTPVFDYSYGGVMRSLEESLDRLNLDAVDIVLIHDLEGHMDEAISGACKALLDLRDQDVVRAVGLGTDYVESALRFLDEADIDCVLIAGRWTLLDQEASNELLSRALERWVAIIAAGVFNSGGLASPREDATFGYTLCPPGIKDRALQMATVCERYGVPLTRILR